MNDSSGKRIKEWMKYAVPAIAVAELCKEYLHTPLWQNKGEDGEKQRK